MSVTRQYDNRDSGERMVLRLYIAGRAPNSTRAVSNLQQLMHHELHDACDYEIIDVLEDPKRALNDGVLVTPTLIKLGSSGSVKIIGDLSNKSKLLHALGLKDA